jgi:hypothetical protein
MAGRIAVADSIDGQAGNYERQTKWVLVSAVR